MFCRISRCIISLFKRMEHLQGEEELQVKDERDGSTRPLFTACSGSFSNGKEKPQTGSGNDNRLIGRAKDRDLYRCRKKAAAIYS